MTGVQLIYAGLGCDLLQKLQIKSGSAPNMPCPSQTRNYPRPVHFMVNRKCKRTKPTEKKSKRIKALLLPIISTTLPLVKENNVPKTEVNRRGNKLCGP